jgi:co-chaperonin GroES (HSP10)
MINKKEKVESIKPLPGWVKVAIEMPKEIKTEGGIILMQDRDKTFKEIKTYDSIVLEKGEGVPDTVKVGNKYRLDVFAGTVIPTEGNKMIKVVEHTLLLGENNTDQAEDYIPNHERLLMKVTSLRDKTDKGIYAPGTQSSIFDLDTLGGEVVSVSPDQEEFYKKGEVLRWEAHAGVPMDFKDKKGDFVSIPIYAVLAKIVD